MSRFTDRRRFLRASAAAAGVGLAGCLDDLAGGEPGENSTDGVGNETDDSGTDDGRDREQTLESWPSFQYDAGNTGHAPGSGPSSVPHEAWRFEGDDVFRGGPVIEDGLVFAGCDDGKLYAVNLEDGSLEWATETPDVVKRYPLAAEGLVIVPHRKGMTAYEQESGEEVWSYPHEEQSAYAPAFEDGTVVFGTGDGWIYGVDVETGGQLWRYEPDRRPSGPAAIENGRAYVADRTNAIHVLSIDDGTYHFSMEIPEGQSTGATVADGVVYVGGYDGGFYALDAQNLGEVLWKKDIGQVIDESPAASENKVYVIGGDELFALDRLNGALEWNQTFDNIGPSAPALVNNALYLGGGWGNFYRLNADSGEITSTLKLGERGLRSPALIEDKIIVGGHNHTISSLE